MGKPFKYAQLARGVTSGKLVSLTCVSNSRLYTLGAYVFICGAVFIIFGASLVIFGAFFVIFGAFFIILGAVFIIFGAFFVIFGSNFVWCFLHYYGYHGSHGP